MKDSFPLHFSLRCLLVARTILHVYRYTTIRGDWFTNTCMKGTGITGKQQVRLLVAPRQSLA